MCGSGMLRSEETQFNCLTHVVDFSMSIGSTMGSTMGCDGLREMGMEVYEMEMGGVVAQGKGLIGEELAEEAWGEVFDSNVSAAIEEYSPGEGVPATRVVDESWESGPPMHWTQDGIEVGGRAVVEPRLTTFFADEPVVYHYSSKANTGHPFPPAIAAIKAKVEGLTGCRYNACLANMYVDGNMAVGWHSDAEHDLVADSPITTVSLGATRQISYRAHAASQLMSLQNDTRAALNASRQPPTPEQSAILARMAEPDLNLDLEHGDVLVMAGTLQTHYRHRVPRDPSVTTPRVVLTFRAVSTFSP